VPAPYTSVIGAWPSFAADWLPLLHAAIANVRTIAEQAKTPSRRRIFAIAFLSKMPNPGFSALI
jgi:hypothetical protein